MPSALDKNYKQLSVPPVYFHYVNGKRCIEIKAAKSNNGFKLNAITDAEYGFCDSSQSWMYLGQDGNYHHFT